MGHRVPALSFKSWALEMNVPPSLTIPVAARVLGVQSKPTRIFVTN